MVFGLIFRGENIVPVLCAFATLTTGWQTVPLFKAGVAGATFAVSRTLYRSRQQDVPFTGRRHFMLLPNGIERAIGDSSAKQIEQKLRFVSAGPALQLGNLHFGGGDVELVQRVVNRLLAVLQQGRGGGYQGHIMNKNVQWEVKVVKEDEPNAYVLPNGNIYIHTGLLDLLSRDEDEVAMVLAHEFGHVVARHSMEKLILSTTINFLKTLFAYVMQQAEEQQAQQGQRRRPVAAPRDDEPVQAGLEDVLVSSPQSRRCEVEADLIGLHLMHLAGYNSRSGIRALARLAKYDTIGMMSLRDLQRSHPHSDVRVAYLEHELSACQEMEKTLDKAAWDRTWTKPKYMSL